MTDFAALGLGVEYVPFVVELTDPKTGLALIDEETGEQAFVEVEGYNSEAGEKLKKAAVARVQRKRKGFRETQADLDTMREENADALAQLTRRWALVNLATRRRIAEDAFPCNQANARALYARRETEWIAAQVQAALAEEANFIKA